MSARSVTSCSPVELRVLAARPGILSARLVETADRVEGCQATELYVFNGNSMKDGLGKMSDFCRELAVSLEVLECGAPFGADEVTPRANAQRQVASCGTTSCRTAAHCNSRIIEMTTGLPGAGNLKRRRSGTLGRSVWAVKYQNACAGGRLAIAKKTCLAMQQGEESP